MGIKFNKFKLQRELRYCDDVARKYLKRESKFKLGYAADQLEYIFHNANRSHPWQIDKKDPLIIKCNNGKHEIDGKKNNLQGRLSFIWELQKCGDNALELVGGKASTAVAIHEFVGSKVNDDPILKWHVDVVTRKDAPGPAFHTQIENPKKIPVPRLPIYLFSPVDCLDFLLGELFQNEWSQHQSGHQKIQQFAAIQKSRIYRMLVAQTNEFEKNGFTSSAWISLKEWKPNDDIFL